MERGEEERETGLAGESTMLDEHDSRADEENEMQYGGGRRTVGRFVPSPPILCLIQCSEGRLL